MKLINQNVWNTYQFSQVLHLLGGSLINELSIHQNSIELKTTEKNVELLLWILKYNSLCQFEQLVDIVVLDIPGKVYRFKLNYTLLSLKYNARRVVSIKTSEIIAIRSINYLYKSAGWLEREVWDLYGIRFIGNSELRRILTDYGFNGHPLRKDFPLTGFIEIYYDDENKRILYEPVELSQEYRVFNLQNPWNLSFTAKISCE